MLTTIPDLLEQTGSQLKALRINANLSQKELADKVNLSESTIVRIEAGKPVGMDAFLKIVRGLGRTEWITELDPIGSSLSPIEQLRIEQGLPQRRSRVSANR